MIFPPTIQINCFGRFRLYQNGIFIPITNKKAEELLAYLLCERHPVKKTKAAEVLWANTDSEKARDSLYKVLRYIRNLQKKDINIPLKVFREELFLDMSLISCDIIQFDSLYQEGESAKQWEQAVSLYKGPLLFDNYYEWTAQEEAYYDIRYCELVQRLVQYYHCEGKNDLAFFYQSKIQ